MAEDNPVSQQVARGMLETLGCAVEVAGTGAEAVAAVRERDYDLVLMDCQMPELDGYEATRAIRAQEDGRRTPVVALTAGAMEGDARRCLDAGMDAHLTKPVRLDDLAGALARWVPEPVVPEVEARAGSGPAPDTPLLDLSTMSALHGDGTRRLVELFLTTSAGQLEQLHAAAGSGDQGELRRLAHSLRGSALYLGAHQLAERCAELEDAADRGEADPGRHVEAVADACGQVEDLLRRQLVG